MTDNIIEFKSKREKDLARIQDEQITAMCRQERDKEQRRESGELPLMIGKGEPPGRSL